jgi:hypothetical protein
MKNNPQMLSYAEFLHEFGNVFEGSGEELKLKRNQPKTFSIKEHPDLKNEIFDLIQTAYAEIGGHLKIQKPDDIFSDPDWNYWEGTDIHGSEDFDIVIFGQKTNYGIKYSGIGHDGSPDAKKAYLASRGATLKKMGFYIEVSGKLAEILIKKYGCPIVDNIDDVTKVLGKPVTWNGKNPEEPNAAGDGWYTRTIGGSPHTKIMLGRPRV